MHQITALKGLKSHAKPLVPMLFPVLGAFYLIRETSPCEVKKRHLYANKWRFSPFKWRFLSKKWRLFQPEKH